MYWLISRVSEIPNKNDLSNKGLFILVISFFHYTALLSKEISV